MKKTYNDVFLTASASDRLNLYKTIQALRAAQVSVSDRIDAQRRGESLVKDINLRAISAATGRNYGSIYNIYNDLLGVLQNLCGDPQADIATLFARPVAEVRMTMIKQTDAWYFLQAVLGGQFATAEEFAASLHLSKLTVMRHLKALRELAESFGVHLHAESMAFTGNERRVRLFLTLVLWKATDGVAWPFADISHDTAGRLMDSLYAALDGQPSNPVAREMAMYYLAVAYARVRDGNILVYDRKQAVLDYPLPNLDLALGHGRFKDFQLPPMTRAQLMGETEFGFLLMHIEPAFIAVDDKRLPVFVERFRRYAPGIYRLVTSFIAAFPEWTQQFGEIDRELLTVNLLAVTASVVAVGEDFNQFVAYTYNHHLRHELDDPHYLRSIRQTLTQVVLAKNLEGYLDLIDPLCENYYRNLLQLRAQFSPQTTLRVALVLEQTSLEYVDLLAMLAQQAFVTVLPSSSGLASADLVIQSGALALNLPAGVIEFKWDVNATPDRFGELFAVLMTLWQEKARSASVQPKERRA